jgi:glycosyltransferase involved in cell wall biosynthesis
MTLFIQINCLNEEENLPKVIKNLPKKIDGIEDIEILIIDDGSTDKTLEIAKKLGVKHFVSHNKNRGLPAAVNTGTLYAIQNGADILVNTDADGQYPESDIERLIKPILEKKADYVYGERQIEDIKHFSDIKKFFQSFGAFIVSLIVGIKLKDAASGFRALNKEAMQRLYLLADYASPLESLIQAKMKNLGIEIVKINPVETKRPSRLVKSIPQYVTKSAGIILDNLIIYRPLQIFFTTGILITLFGFLVGLVRLVLVRQNPDNESLTLLLIAIASIIVGSQSIFFGLMARANRANRIIAEETFYRVNLKL